MSGNGDIHVPDQETTFLKNVTGDATRRKKGRREEKQKQLGQSLQVQPDRYVTILHVTVL